MKDWLPEAIGETKQTQVKPVRFDPAVAFDASAPPLVRAAYILQKAGKFHDEAAAVAAMAAENLPSDATAWDCLGTALRALNRVEDAVAAYEEGLRLDPANLRIRANLGAAYTDVGRVIDGIIMLEGVLAERPNFSYAFLALMKAVLMTGDLERGWMLYSQRVRIKDFAVQTNTYPVPKWDGVRKERVLMVGEEGSGEKLMFASMIPDALATGAEIIIEAPKSFERFAPLMRRSFPGLELVVEDSGEVGAQSQILAGDMGRLFRPTLASFPRHKGYLKADPARVEWFRDYFARHFPGRRVVGFSWRGGDNLARFKSLPLAGFAPLLRTPDTVFVDLQFGPADGDRKSVAEAGLPVPHRIPSLDTWNDMDGLAACMCACDEIITVSNTNAHIAGALGLKVTNVIPKTTGCMWFWFENREDSPWYPSMRVVRHRWGDPLDSLIETLRKGMRPADEVAA